MNYQETQQAFVELWGRLGTNWGINKAMAQIHALLLSAEAPLTTDEVMGKLQISRSNANLNLRALLDWGLIYKKHLPGDRKEYFVAEKDIWSVAVKIMKERRRREVEPVVDELKQLAQFEANNYNEKNFKKLLEDTIELSEKLTSIGTMVEKADKFNFFKWILRGF